MVGELSKMKKMKDACICFTIIQACVADENDSLLGKTLHVDFKNLGTLSKAAYTLAVEGNWNFEIILPYNRVIDVDEVAALIVLTLYENEKVEIPISK